MIINRIKSNQNFIAFVTGGTGSGKSYSCLSLAEMCHRELGLFDELGVMPPLVVYDAEDLLGKINLILENPKSYPKGLNIIVDEAGLMAHSRQFMSKMNVAMSKLVQSFRFMNLVVWLALPNIGFTDTHLRAMAHCHFVTTKIDKKRQLCYLKPYNLRDNQYTGKITRSLMRVITKAGEVKVIGHIGVPKPSRSISDEYEKNKHEYMKALYVDFADFDKVKSKGVTK